MNEYQQGLMGSLALLPSMIFSVLSWIGGRPNGRIYKRVLAPLAFCLAMFLLAFFNHHFNWVFLTAIPAYMISASLGYGGETLWKKIIRRSIWSLVRTLCSIIFVLFTGKWTLFLVQCGVGLLTTLIFGIINPLEAPEEEGLINFSSVFIVPFMVL